MYRCLKDECRLRGRDSSTPRRSLTKAGVELVLMPSYPGGPQMLYYKESDHAKVEAYFARQQMVNEDAINAPLSL